MSLNFADLYLASKAALSNSVHISVHHIQWRILALNDATPNSLKFITLTFNKTAISSRKMEKKKTGARWRTSARGVAASTCDSRVGLLAGKLHRLKHTSSFDKEDYLRTFSVEFAQGQANTTQKQRERWRLIYLAIIPWLAHKNSKTLVKAHRKVLKTSNVAFN